MNRADLTLMILSQNPVFRDAEGNMWVLMDNPDRTGKRAPKGKQFPTQYVDIFYVNKMELIQKQIVETKTKRGIKLKYYEKGNQYSVNKLVPFEKFKPLAEENLPTVCPFCGQRTVMKFEAPRYCYYTTPRQEAKYKQETVMLTEATYHKCEQAGCYHEQLGEKEMKEVLRKLEAGEGDFVL